MSAIAFPLSARSGLRVSGANHRTQPARPHTSNGNQRLRKATGVPSGAFCPHDRFGDEPMGLGDVTPAQELHPFAGLEVLVVDEEVLDLVARDLGQVGVRL